MSNFEFDRKSGVLKAFCVGPLPFALIQEVVRQNNERPLWAKNNDADQIIKLIEEEKKELAQAVREYCTSLYCCDIGSGAERMDYYLLISEIADIIYYLIKLCAVLDLNVPSLQVYSLENRPIPDPEHSLKPTRLFDLDQLDQKLNTELDTLTASYRDLQSSPAAASINSMIKALLRMAEIVGANISELMIFKMVRNALKYPTYSLQGGDYDKTTVAGKVFWNMYFGDRAFIDFWLNNYEIIEKIIKTNGVTTGNGIEVLNARQAVEDILSLWREERRKTFVPLNEEQEKVEPKFSLVLVIDDSETQLIPDSFITTLQGCIAEYLSLQSSKVLVHRMPVSHHFAAGMSIGLEFAAKDRVKFAELACFGTYPLVLAVALSVNCHSQSDMTTNGHIGLALSAINGGGRFVVTNSSTLNTMANGNGRNAFAELFNGIPLSIKRHLCPNISKPAS